MPATATNTLQATITSTDANGNTSINRGFGNPTLGGNYGQEMINQQLPAGANVLNLPSNPVYNFYIKNNAAAGSGITFTLTVTPNGQAAVLATPIIDPGGVFLLWNTLNTTVTHGYSAITVTVVGGTCPVEYFFGA